MAYWECPVDGFRADNQEEKEKHLMKNADDPKHQGVMKQEAESKMDEAKEKGSDVWEDFKRMARDIFR
ncbi:MAG: hypothetical protein M1372_01795 [Patescibacteria group bacterium]|nr:hypothetical protein [Patescibacteria group bacterium]